MNTGDRSGSSGGRLVEVAFARDPGEGMMIQSLLRAAGIRSLLKPTGINGPLIGEGLLPPGSERVFVRADQVDAARLHGDAELGRLRQGKHRP